jgi:hypothetical protein
MGVHRAKWWCIVLVVGALAGCATRAPKPPPTTAELVQSAAVNDTAYDAFRTYSLTPTRSWIKREQGLYTFYDELSVSLAIARHKQTAKVSYVLVVAVQYDEQWRNYGSASLPGGAVLPARNVARQVLSCTRVTCRYHESMGFEIPGAALVGREATGLALRLNPGAGPAIEIALTPQHLQAAAQLAQR